MVAKYFVYIKSLLVILSLLLVSSCSERLVDDGTPERNANTGIYEVDSVFEPYIQKFIDEGKKRYKNINIRSLGLIMKFVNMAEVPNNQNAAGLTFTDSIPVVIYIDKENWEKYSNAYDKGEFEHSFVIYHELGHAFLKRPHYNKTLVNGDYISIMVGGDLPPGQLNRANFRGSRMEYYFNELFLPGSKVPAWGDSSFFYKFSNSNIGKPIFTTKTLNTNNGLYKGKFPIINNTNLFQNSVDTTRDIYYELKFGFDSTATDDKALFFACNGTGNSENYSFYSAFSIYKNGFLELSTYPEGPLVQYSVKNDSISINKGSDTITLGILVTGNNTYWFYNNQPIYFAESRLKLGDNSLIRTENGQKIAFLVQYAVYYPTIVTSKSANEMPFEFTNLIAPKQFFGKSRYKQL